MHLDARGLRLSPSDLSAFLVCRHRTGLDLAVAHGVLDRPDSSDAMAQALRDRGAAHERAYVERLRADGLTLLEIPSDVCSAERVSATTAAVRNGIDVVVQAALIADGWTGYADILRRVDTPSALGPWSYEPLDTKLARETRAGTILQLATYTDLLEPLQGMRPEHVHVVTPAAPLVDGAEATLQHGFAVHSYRIADFVAYFRLVRRQLAHEVTRGHHAILSSRYPEPVEACDVCRWWTRCNRRRRSDDHLSFVAGTGRLHRHELAAQGYSTMARAAALPLPIAFKPSRGSRDAYTRIREQARLQLLQRRTGRPAHELLPFGAGRGLARLPEPSTGDLFLDLEGNRFAREGGREFLFGLWRHGIGPLPGDRYGAAWSFTDLQERFAFTAVIDRVLEAWDADPGMHVYHFGHYEPAALKRLVGRYAERGDALDRLLRAERFVDLHAIVRQSLRAGVESYSLKQLEPFYGFVRDVPLADTRASLLAVELALEANVPWTIGADARALVERYNRDDCRSAEALRDWLERLRAEAVAGGAPIARPVQPDGAPTDKVRKLESRQAARRAQLLASVAPEAIDPQHAQHAYWLLAYLIDWHRREDKTQYWERFRLAAMSDDELLEERLAIAGLQFVERLEESRFKNGNLKTVVDRYRYPLQEVELGRKGELRSPGNLVAGSIHEHDRLARTIDIKKGRDAHQSQPSAVFQAIAISTDVQQEALLRFSAAPDAESCGADLLFRRPPRLRSGEFRQRADETTARFAVRLATELDRTTLAIQGPPGAGKTYVGAEMIRALVRAGRKVGVTAGSHQVIRNLLDAVAAQDRDAGVRSDCPVQFSVAADEQLQLDWDSPDESRHPIALAHKCDSVDDDDDDSAHSPVREFGDNAASLSAVASGAIDVLGATSWLWSRAEAAGAVDVLFVDEAGQMSLANALAVSGAAGSLVLLGDPQQLEQPQKGSHPDGVGVSALEHVLDGAPTMPVDRGLFLPTTWRLHPSICAFTSELFYDGKLRAKAGLDRQRLSGTGELDGAGLWWVSVEHDGSQNHSIEEIDVVARLVDRLLAPGAAWIDEHGVSRQLAGGDLRIVAPFNAQVNRLSERLAGCGVPVGTVDRFQGQEAAVVIYSMAASRAEDAPHGMEFLYSLNRLNVATSRARCAAILVSSPHLCEPECRTPRQLMLANALCRFVEMATRISVRDDRPRPGGQHLVGEQETEEHAGHT